MFNLFDKAKRGFQNDHFKPKRGVITTISVSISRNLLTRSRNFWPKTNNLSYSQFVEKQNVNVKRQERSQMRHLCILLSPFKARNKQR